MSTLASLVLGLVLAAAPARGQSPSSFGKLEFQDLLQRFVDEQYLKGFRELGEESDFDHGHLLFAAPTRGVAPGRPIAILYHTQELSQDGSANPAARNWLQWVEGGAVEDASRYLRKGYPRSASWDWFVLKELPDLRRRRTILDKMLDPALLGAEIARSDQWAFTRVECGGPPRGSDLIGVLLPGGRRACLALSRP